MENVFVLVEREDRESSRTLGVFKTLDASEVFANKSKLGPWSAWQTVPYNVNRRERYSLERTYMNQVIEMHEVQA